MSRPLQTRRCRHRARRRWAPHAHGPLVTNRRRVAAIRIRATWGGAQPWPFIAGYRVHRQNAWQASRSTALMCLRRRYVSPPLKPAITYTVLVYARSTASAPRDIASISLVSTGIGALVGTGMVAGHLAHDIGSWTLATWPGQYQHWPWRQHAAHRMDFSAVVENSAHRRQYRLTPGLATDLLDAGSFLVSPVTWDKPARCKPHRRAARLQRGRFAYGRVCAAEHRHWVALYNGNMRVGCMSTPSTGPTPAPSSPPRTVAVVISVRTRRAAAVRTVAIRFDAATIAAMMPTVTDPVVPRQALASGGVVVQMPRKYIHRDQRADHRAGSSTTAKPVTPILNVRRPRWPTTLTLRCFDAAGGVACRVPCSDHRDARVMATFDERKPNAGASGTVSVNMDAARQPLIYLRGMLVAGGTTMPGMATAPVATSPQRRRHRQTVCSNTRNRRQSPWPTARITARYFFRKTHLQRLRPALTKPLRDQRQQRQQLQQLDGRRRQHLPQPHVHRRRRSRYAYLGGYS